MPNTRRMNRLEELGRVDSEKAYTKKGKKNKTQKKKDDDDDGDAGAGLSYF